MQLKLLAMQMVFDQPDFPVTMFTFETHEHCLNITETDYAGFQKYYVDIDHCKAG